MKEEREKMKREEKEEKSEEVSEKSDEFYDWINFGTFKLQPNLKEEITDFCKRLYDFMIKENITFNLLFNGRYEKDLPENFIERIEKYKNLKSTKDKSRNIWKNAILPSFEKHFNDNRIKIIEEKIKECKQIIDVYNLDIQKIIKRESYKPYLESLIRKEKKAIIKKKYELLLELMVYIHLHDKENLMNTILNRVKHDDVDLLK